MTHERGLDLVRPDPVSGRDDDVVAAALEPKRSVLVLAHVVAGRPPFAVDQLWTAIGIQVAGEERRTGRRLQLELAVQDAQLDPGERPAHRSRLHGVAGLDPGERAGLGLAVAVADLEPRPLTELVDHLRVERLTGRDRAPD